MTLPDLEGRQSWQKKVLDISDRMLQSPKTSIRKLSQQVGASYGTAHAAFKKTPTFTPLQKWQLYMNWNLATVLSG